MSQRDGEQPLKTSESLAATHLTQDIFTLNDPKQDVTTALLHPTIHRPTIFSLDLPTTAWQRPAGCSPLQLPFASAAVVALWPALSSASHPYHDAYNHHNTRSSRSHHARSPQQVPRAETAASCCLPTTTSPTMGRSLDAAAAPAARAHGASTKSYQSPDGVLQRRRHDAAQ